MTRLQTNRKLIPRIAKAAIITTRALGPITQDKVVYFGFIMLFLTTLSVNGFEACWTSTTGQFVAATSVYPIAFETTTLTASIPENDSVVATSYNPVVAKSETGCKINLDGYNQIGEQTTESGKTFMLFNKDKIIIVPKDNQDSGNVVLQTTGNSLKITACGSLTEQGLLVGQGADAPKFNLGELNEEGKPKSFKTKIKKGTAKKSEPLILTIL
jgi:hypothetical protein